FGIAKFLHAERTLTRTGMTLGTSSYLAPEQLRGEPVDRRADIFSFGALAYELLSYQKAFAGENKAATFEAVIKEDPRPLTEVATATPPALGSLVARSMSKRPDQRYPSMEPIRRELLDIREELRRAGQPAPAGMEAPPPPTAAV